MPLPMKIRMKSAIGFAVKAPVADALGMATAVLAAPPISGSPLVVVEAAAFTAPACEPSSRRLAANAAEARGPATGTPPSLPAPSQDSRLPLSPVTAQRGEAAVMTGAAGASAATGTLTDSTSGLADGAGDEESAVESTWVTAAGAGGAGVSTGEGATDASAVGADSIALSASGASTTISGAELLRRFGVLTAAEPPGTPARGEADARPPGARSGRSSEVALDVVPELRAPPRVAAEREPARDGLDLGAESDAEAVSAELAVEPAEPVVSANATGIAATADQTPNATASAPTRPTYDAVPVADSLACTARRRYSIACTRLLDERRWLPVD